MYKHLFGPVPSRRLGISLGLDLVPMKSCSLNCTYCECGATTRLTLDRKEYVPFNAIKEELTHYFSHNPEPDYITFSGAGEPTLNSKIGEVLGFLESQISDIPVAVLTNGTLLYQKEVRDDIKGATIVIPSLDAATGKIFTKINRPHPGLRIKTIIDGIVRFRKEYTGQIWLEVFLVPGLNDTREELAGIKQAIERIEPDQVQLNTLDRPGAVTSIRPATRKELERVLDFWQLDNASIIAQAPARKALRSFRTDVESTILETIARRPCTLEDLTSILGMHANEINKYLGVLEADGKIKTIAQERGYFYQLNRA